MFPQGENMKKFKRASATTLMVAMLMGLVSCGTPTGSSSQTQTTQEPIATQSSVESTQVVESTQAVEPTQPVATEAEFYDYDYAFPHALFYSPEYPELTEEQDKKLNEFVSFKAAGNAIAINAAITSGTWIYSGDVVVKDGKNYHRVTYATWDNRASTDFLISEETYNNIEIVLKRSADYYNIVGDNNKGYVYKYNGNPYDKNEVNVLRSSLYFELSEGYHKNEWNEYYNIQETATNEETMGR